MRFDQWIEPADIFLIGMPVYFGKIPHFLTEAFKGNPINARGKSAIAVVVYGNKGSGIALKQLVSLLNASNFQVIGAAAFIGEHSLSSVFPVALGRPDEHDLSLAREFGAHILNTQGKLQSLQEIDIPGKRDTLLRMTPPMPPKPQLHLERCIDCGICVQSCPMGIIDIETKRYKNRAAEKLCLGCMRCVKNCPQGARLAYLSPPLKYLTGKLFLDAAVTHRNEPFIITKEI